MADAGFKHIAVTAAEEDDEVITAGIKPADHVQVEVAEPSRAEAEGAQNHGEGDAVVGEGEPEASLVADDGGDVSAISEAPQTSEASASADTPAKPATGKPAGRSARKREEYRETTLEDLKPQPMSTTQRVVIIAAVVCIIGALVYYFVFMG